MEVTNPGHGSEKIKRIKKIILTLGITETVLGLICCVLGTVVLGHTVGQTSHLKSDRNCSDVILPCWNIGEGLWGGVWLVVGGALGIACGKKSVSRCLVSCHMTFSIVGAGFAGIMFSTAIQVAMEYQDLSYSVGVDIESTIAGLSFIAMLLCSTSASLCCCTPPIDLGSNECCAVCYGCCDSPEPQRVPTGQSSGFISTGKQQTFSNIYESPDIQTKPMELRIPSSNRR